MANGRTSNNELLVAITEIKTVLDINNETTQKIHDAIYSKDGIHSDIQKNTTNIKQVTESISQHKKEHKYFNQKLFGLGFAVVGSVVAKLLYEVYMH